MKRRLFINSILTGIIAAPFSLLLRKSNKAETASKTLWQIDPDKCTHCGKCVTKCILPHSAVKCVHQYASCGYCLFCSGYYHDKRARFDTAGENLRCPTDAINRTYIQDPYFEYTIDEDKCIACAKCVRGCEAFGNGSLFLQVRHNICVNCNQCRIASVCPADAFVKVSPDMPYLIKNLQEDAT
ncbi:MAG: 4Fe-4S binding protein [Phycisphaeraceae bacterium JB051]